MSDQPVTDAVSPDVPPAPAAPEWAPPPPHRRRSVPWSSLVLGLALALSLGVAGWMGLQVYDDDRQDNARRQATAAAQTYAVQLTTYDHTTLEQDFARVLANSTGAFRAQYTAASESLRALIVRFKGTATGEVLSTAVVSSDTDQAVVLLFVDQTVNNAQTKEPRVDRSRMRMELEKQDDRWLISDLELV